MAVSAMRTAFSGDVQVSFDFAFDRVILHHAFGYFVVLQASLKSLGDRARG